MKRIRCYIAVVCVLGTTLFAADPPSGGKAEKPGNFVAAKPDPLVGDWQGSGGVVAQVVATAGDSYQANLLPAFDTEIVEVLSPTNPLGIKGCGEAGCAGSLTSVMNAIADALSEYGIRHLDMPATPYRVWNAIREARSAQSA